MSSFKHERRHRFSRSNDEANESHGDTLEIDHHHHLLEVSEGLKWADICFLEKSKSCGIHSLGCRCRYGYWDIWRAQFVAGDAHRSQKTQQWESINFLLNTPYLKRGFFLEFALQGHSASSRMFKSRIAECGFGNKASKQDWQAFAILRHRPFTAESQLRQVEFDQASYVRWAAAPVSTDSYKGSAVPQYMHEYSVEGDQGPKKCREDDCMWLGKTLSGPKKHEAQHGFAHRCGVGDYSSVFATVNDLDRHKACVRELRESGTQVSRCLSGLQELENLETEWSRKDNFRVHMSQHHLAEEEDDHRTESLERWNDQYRALVREVISSKMNANIKKKQVGLAMLWHEGLEESPADHCTSGPTGFDIPSRRIMSHTQRAEMIKIGIRIACDPAHDDGLTKDREGEPLERSDSLLLIMGQIGVGKSTFVNAFVNCLSSPSLEEAMHDEQLRSLIPCNSKYWSVSSNIRNGHGALHNATRQMRASTTSMFYHLQQDHLLLVTEYHAKTIDRGDVTAQKPQPPPARMSPDDDDDDESYGFRRAQSRLASRHNEEWRAVIARVCNPFSRATEHEMGRLCEGTSASGERVTRLTISAESNAVETY